MAVETDIAAAGPKPTLARLTHRLAHQLGLVVALLLLAAALLQLIGLLLRQPAASPFAIMVTVVVAALAYPVVRLVGWIIAGAFGPGD